MGFSLDPAPASLAIEEGVANNAVRPGAFTCRCSALMAYRASNSKPATLGETLGEKAGTLLSIPVAQRCGREDREEYGVAKTCALRRA
jgi:hypothetical protein